MLTVKKMSEVPEEEILYACNYCIHCHSTVKRIAYSEEEKARLEIPGVYCRKCRPYSSEWEPIENETVDR